MHIKEITFAMNKHKLIEASRVVFIVGRDYAMPSFSSRIGAEQQEHEPVVLTG